MKYILYVVLVFVIGAGAYIFVTRDTPFPVVPDTGMQVTTLVPMELCFAEYGPVQPSGYSDTYTLRMTLDGTQVSGELKFLPAEKDSKVGLFTGDVSAVDPYSMARTITAMWDTYAEGMNTTEELSIVFGEGTASIGFGPMVDRGDGVYVYEESDEILYNMDLTDIACADLTERENIEAYIRQNIATIAPEKAQLGGTWYVVTNTIDITTNTGTVIYEDGHIQKTSNYTYETDAQSKVTTVSFITDPI